MSRFQVRPAAVRDLEDAATYLSRHGGSVPERFLDSAAATFEFLAKHPMAGRGRRFRIENMVGLRSWPVRGFRAWLVFYIPREEGVEIVRVLHAARRLGRALRGTPQ